MRKGAKLVYYHYSPVEVKRVRTRKQWDEAWRKPKGLWLSDDTANWSWPEFVTQNTNFPLEFRHKVTIKQTANVKYITNEKALLKFTEKYRTNKYKGTEMWQSGFAIDWKRVEKKYDGIIITPYIWNWGLMRHANWYYGWDCASGCIWNKRAIESIEVCTSSKV